MSNYINELRKNHVRRFYENVWNKHRIDMLPLYLHNSMVYKSDSEKKHSNVDGLIASLNDIHKAFKGFRSTLINQAAEGNMVSCRILNCGIHQLEYRGLIPSGKSVSWESVSVFTFKNRVISGVSNFDELFTKRA